MQGRRKQSLEKKKETALMALIALGAGFLWTMAILFFSLRLDHSSSSLNDNYDHVFPTTSLSSSSSSSMSSSSSDARQRKLLRPTSFSFSSTTATFTTNPLANLPMSEYQLWPDDDPSGNRALVKFLAECASPPCLQHYYHHQKKRAQYSLRNQQQPPTHRRHRTTTRVLLIRPPGVFGSVMEEFVSVLIQSLNQQYQQQQQQQQQLEESNAADDDENPLLLLNLEVHRYPPSRLDILPDDDNDNDDIRIIRVVTFPILLEAMDLALTVMATEASPGQPLWGSTTTQTAIPTWTDVEQIVRLLVQWQGQINNIVKLSPNDNHHGQQDEESNSNEKEDLIPTFLLSLQSTMLIPQKNEDRLTRFLMPTASSRKTRGLFHNNNNPQQQDWTTPVVPRDALAQRVLQRVDQTTQVLSQILSTTTKRVEEAPPMAMVQEWIEQEMQQISSMGSSATIPNHHHDNNKYSPIVQQVHALLQWPDEQLCETFPKLCPRGENPQVVVPAPSF
ncbi:hypothetical protein ACA910_005772 [Epithemia clementina (nom. ined.)]